MNVLVYGWTYKINIIYSHDFLGPIMCLIFQMFSMKLIENTETVGSQMYFSW